MGVCVGVGLFLVGKKDLPKAANWLGTQLGRAVGLLQGARIRADQYASNNELKALQNELRSGLRELDAVKAELAVSMSPQGVMGRQLGPTVPGANRVMAATTAGGVGASNMNANQPALLQQQPLASLSSNIPPTSASGSTQGDSVSQSATSTSSVSSVGGEGLHAVPQQPHQHQRVLPPAAQTIAAVAEAEWKNQGIHFASRAEQGLGINSKKMDTTTSGSAILGNLLQQSLIFDQYERTVQEQDRILQSKLETAFQKQQQEKSDRRREPKGSETDSQETATNNGESVTTK